MGWDTTDLAHGLFQVLEAGDPVRAADVVHEGFHHREAAVSPPACARPGAAGVLAAEAWMRFAFGDLRFPALGIARNDDQIWVRRRRMQGRHKGSFVRFRDGVLGRDIDVGQIRVLDLCDGKVVRQEASTVLRGG